MKTSRPNLLRLAEWLASLEEVRVLLFITAIVVLTATAPIGEAQYVAPICVVGVLSVVLRICRVIRIRSFATPNGPPPRSPRRE